MSSARLRDGVHSVPTQSDPRDAGTSGGPAQGSGVPMDETQTTASNRPTWWNAEHLRILKAAERGALQVNESGRWFIADEEERPRSAERKHLTNGWKGWYPAVTSPLHRNDVVALTVDGRELLRELPSMIEGAPR